jgi:hypothetical protein
LNFFSIPSSPPLSSPPLKADVGDYGNLLYVRSLIHTGSQGLIIPHQQQIVIAEPQPAQNRSCYPHGSAPPSEADIAAAENELQRYLAAKLACKTPGAVVAFDTSHHYGAYTDPSMTLCNISCSDHAEARWFGLLGAPIEGGRNRSTEDVGGSVLPPPPFTINSIFDRLMYRNESECDVLHILPAFGCNTVQIASANSADDLDDASASGSPPTVLKRPRLDLPVQVTDDAGTGSLSAPCDTGQLFHLDAQGNSCFSVAEAARASAHLADGDFLGHLLRRVKTTAFVLPQSRAESQAFFCNEVRGLCMHCLPLSSSRCASF